MFNIGESVRLKIDDAVVGIVVEVLPEVEGSARYRVFHDATRIGEYYEDQLVSACLETESPGIDVDEFISRYAAVKYSLPSSSSIFSLSSGRINFIPYQFRPLKKIATAERPRILIADEVGVGKTIEAGLILKEYEKRENVQSVAIVCPHELCAKWQREMKSRFGEAFQIIDSGAFSYVVQETKLEGEWPTEMRKCIFGLEMVRRSQNVEALRDLGLAAHFDMLIIDEAHHVVNDSSLSYDAAEFFTENSDIAVLLSATPIQLKSRDLYVLLNLLLPEEFNDERLFSAMAQPNHYINGAIRAIRDTTRSGWQTDALDSLQRVASVNEWAEQRFHGNAQLTYWTNRLAQSDIPLTDEERIACLRDLEDLHSFAHVINRTKRRDIGAFTLREPITVEVEYCNEERAFYEAARSFEAAVYTALHGSQTAKMIMTTVERLMTSCLPAFVGVLDRFIARGFVALSELTDDIDEEVDFHLDGGFLEAADTLKALADRLPARDAKTDKLLEVIDATLRAEGDGKLLVFSFFKHTLRYLVENIEAAGYTVGLITGETHEIERDMLRERFRLPKDHPYAINVLLSSEVGCEGLDYEFCSRMVNYDIPWNPMKIEQRIGRIDRFGQKSPKVLIYNFVTKGTVEQRVFFRCYERLGIFNSTVGDLESVLGRVQSELTEAAFGLSLTEQQERVKVQQSIDNAIRDRNEQTDFETSAKDLFLVDLARDDQLVGRDRSAQMCMIKRVVCRFLLTRYPQCSVRELEGELLCLRMDQTDRIDLRSKTVALRKNSVVDASGQEYQAFDKFLSGDCEDVELAFDGELKVDDNQGLLVTVTHPLFILALTENDSVADAFVSMRCCAGLLPAGQYGFACYEWKECGYRVSSSIVVLLEDKRTGEILELPVGDFETLMLSARTDGAQPANRPSNALEGAMRRRQLMARQRLSETNDDIVRRKMSTLDSSYGKKIARIQEACAKTDNEKVLRMRKSQIANLETRWQEGKARLTAKLESDVIVRLFAHGDMEVEQP